MLASTMGVSGSDEASTSGLEMAGAMVKVKASKHAALQLELATA